MTVRRVCFPFVGDSVGGSQIAAAMLIDGLDRTRYVPRVVLHERGPLADYLAERNVEFEFMPIRAYVGSGRGALANVINLAATTPMLWRYLKRGRMSIVHTQDGRMNQTWGSPARMSGAGFVWHQHSKYAVSRLTRQAMALANRIICSSEFVCQSLPAAVKSNALTIENPFDTEVKQLDRIEARHRVLQEVGLPAGGRIVAFIGNLTAQKRPEVFLHAAAGIHDGDSSPFRFLIFGRDRKGLQPKLEALANELGIGDAVRFMGFHDPIGPWLAASDLLLAPEVDEGFGRTLVEAILAGTPVIATDSGGHREIIDCPQTGILTPPDDASAMSAAALSMLADTTQRNEMTHRARDAAVARYAVQAHAAMTMDVYDRLQSAKY